MEKKIAEIKVGLEVTKGGLLECLNLIDAYKESMEMRELLARFLDIPAEEIDYNPAEDVYSFDGFKYYIRDDRCEFAELYEQEIEKWINTYTYNLPDAIRDNINYEDVVEQLCEDPDELQHQLDVQIQKFEGFYICEPSQ